MQDSFYYELTLVSYLPNSHIISPQDLFIGNPTKDLICCIIMTLRESFIKLIICVLKLYMTSVPTYLLLTMIDDCTDNVPIL